MKCTALRAHAPTADGVREDPWAVLGLSSEASRGEVKARFRQLVRQHHPDVDPGGSGETMLRVIRAAEAILNSLPKQRPAQAPAPAPTGVHRSRYERQRAKRERREAARAAEERLVYTGRSRLHGARWSNYRITLAEIEISWPLAPYQRQQGAVDRKRVSFRDISAISSHLDLTGRYDVELELACGTKLTLERLPPEVVSQVAQSVRLAQWQKKARLENIMGGSA